MTVPVHHRPVVTTVSIDIFSSFTTNIKKGRDPLQAYRTWEALRDVWRRL